MSFTPEADGPRQRLSAPAPVQAPDPADRPVVEDPIPAGAGAGAGATPEAAAEPDLAAAEPEPRGPEASASLAASPARPVVQPMAEPPSVSPVPRPPRAE